MAVSSLYRLHPPALAATHADLENHALALREVLSGTPGSVVVRHNATGTAFYARQFYDHERVKRDRYVAGPVGNPEADALAEGWRVRIAEANELIRSVKILLREGYLSLEPNSFAALGPLCNHGLFEAGALLVGTHAFGAIVNRIGIRVSSFPTVDIDIARPARLTLASVLTEGFLGLLRESGIAFVAVPEFGHGAPSTKFKEAGRSRLQVDLLAPATGREISVKAVPELGAHATALPYLQFLVAQTQPGIVLSHHGIAAVRVPLPERYALQKLVVSELRVGRSEKSLKDRRQSAVLLAAMAELFPGSIAEAWKDLSRSGRSYALKALEKVKPLLAAHPQAVEEIAALTSR
jgi:hypothetical protein